MGEAYPAGLALMEVPTRVLEFAELSPGRRIRLQVQPPLPLSEQVAVHEAVVADGQAHELDPKAPPIGIGGHPEVVCAHGRLKKIVRKIF